MATISRNQRKKARPLTQRVSRQVHGRAHGQDQPTHNGERYACGSVLGLEADVTRRDKRKLEERAILKRESVGNRLGAKADSLQRYGNYTPTRIPVHQILARINGTPVNMM